MSTYDSYEPMEAPRRHKHRHHHRDRDDRDLDSESRYVETRETYVRSPPRLVSDVPYSSRETDLVRRTREDSDLSIEEVQRDFSPPVAGAYMRDDRYVSVRSRSPERDREYGQYLADPRDERHTRKKVVKEEIVEPRRRSLSRNQKILAAVGGAALAVGGKELWDRRQNGGHAPEDRNLIAAAAVGAAGALAGYKGAEFAAKKIGGDKERKVKESTYIASRSRDGEVAEYYSSDSDHEKPKKSHRRSVIEGALALAGVGAAAKAASGGSDDRSDQRSRRRSGSVESTRSTRSRRRDKSRGGDDSIAKYQQSAKAALLAGAAEAFRIRKEPGGLSGAKAKRILTAAIGAGGIDAAADRDPEHHSKRHILEAVIGGLAGNRLINGSRKELEGGGRSGRSRSRSRAPSSSGLGSGAGLAALATAGIGALAGKKLLDRSRSRSRADDDREDRRSRRRTPSEDSDDSRHGHRRRSKSVTDFARKGLAALGIGEAAEAGRDERRRDRDRDVVEETHATRKSHRSHRDSSDDDGYDDRRDYVSSRDDPYADSRGSRDSRGKKDKRRDRRAADDKRAESDSDSLGSSSGDEKRVRKMKGKQLLTAGLATVATIHAAHNVYQSYEKRKARKKAVASGKMSKDEAAKLKSKALLQDAASVGIAALGIRGAVSEWKEMKEIRHEYKEFEEKKEERHKKRLERQRHDGSVAEDSGTVALRPAHHTSAPDLTYGGHYHPPASYYTDGSRYAGDDLPAPPVGYAYQQP